MLLRSSSTPVLGSLLSSYSESPNHHHHHPPEPHTAVKRPPTPVHQNHNKLSFHHAAGSLNHTAFSRNPSPISSSISEFSDGGRISQSGFRRAQSEGNLEGLAIDEFSISNPPKKFLRRPNTSLLETIPSFSVHNARNRYEDDEDSDEEEEEKERENGGFFENSLAVRGSELNMEKQNVGLNDETRFLNACRSLGFEENKEYTSELYLARGLGVDSVDIGYGGGHNRGGGGSSGGGGGDSDGTDDGNRPSIEEHYKRLVEENPGNPLFLRNYAQFLYESKQDLPRAEEYYSRAILADPKDGEVLSQYAKLIWELHHDPDRASSYFERAVHTSPEDSHVHAAHASFLWEAEEDGDDATNDPCTLPSHFKNGAMASASA